MSAIAYQYLSDNEKLEILGSHIRSLEYTVYNLEVSKLAAQAVSTPDLIEIDNINNQITEVNAKIAALETEKATLTV